MPSSTLEPVGRPEESAEVVTATAEQPAILKHPESETYVWDGVVYNADGEEIGLADEPATLDVPEDPDEREVNKILRSLTRTYHRENGALSRVEAIGDELKAMEDAALKAIRGTVEFQALESERDQALSIAKKAGVRGNWLQTNYLDFLRLYTLPRLTGRTKTLEMLAGSISLRKINAKLNVTDERAATDALESLGEENAIKRTVLKDGISDELKLQLLKGEATLSGIDVVPETQKVGVTVGGAKIV